MKSDSDKKCIVCSCQVSAYVALPGQPDQNEQCDGPPPVEDSDQFKLPFKNNRNQQQRKEK
jgi:hypothetical protein